MPETVDEVRALTALVLDLDPESLTYITEDSIAADLAAFEQLPEEDPTQNIEEVIGSTTILSLIYNTPKVLPVNGVMYIFYFLNCDSAPRQKILLSRKIRTFQVGICGPTLGKYKMLYN
jgi:hypothetical protein